MNLTSGAGWQPVVKTVARAADFMETVKENLCMTESDCVS